MLFRIPHDRPLYTVLCSLLLCALALAADGQCGADAICAARKPVTAMTADEIRSELSLLASTYGFVRPGCSNVDPDRPWMHGLPDFDAIDLLYFRGKSTNHSPDSPEFAMENFMKEWGNGNDAAIAGGQDPR